MLKAIKTGFGFAIGYHVGKTLLYTTTVVVCANSDTIMEHLSISNPKLYEKLKEYRID